MKKIFTVVAAASLAASGAYGVPVKKSGASVDCNKKVQMPVLRSESVSEEVIYDTPDGELKWLDRSCDGFLVEAFDATHGPVIGSVVQMVEDEYEDGVVYLSHMASEYPVNTWVKAEKVDNTLVIDGIQAIYEEYDWDYEEVFKIYLAPMQLVLDENNRGTFVVPDDPKFVFNIAEDGTLTAADPELLLGVCVRTLNEDREGNDVWIWKGFGDRDIKMTVTDNEPVSLPEGLETEDWVWSDEYDMGFVQVAIDGNDFYINGMNRSLPDAWIKGAINDGKVVFPSGQYLGADMEIDYYSYFCGAEFTKEVDEDGYEVLMSSLAESAIFAYDAEAKKLTTERGYVINASADQLYPLYAYEDVTVAKQKNRNPSTPPAAPYDLVLSQSEYETSIWFQIPNTDVEGNLLNEKNLYYEVYVDDVPQEFVIVDEDLNETESSLVPYSYSDWYDIWVSGKDHTIYLYEPVQDSVGVRSIYINENGEEVASDMTVCSATGVKEMNVGKKIVSEKYFDLQGRRINSLSNGLVIKVVTFEDGTSKTVKMLRK